MVLRPITGAIPPDGPWGIWALAPDHRRTHGHVRALARGHPSGTSQLRSAGRTPGRRRMGVWTAQQRDQCRTRWRRHLLRTRQRLHDVFAPNPPAADILAVVIDRATGIQCRLPTGAALPFPDRGHRRAGSLGLVSARMRLSRGAHGDRRGFRGWPSDRRHAAATRGRRPTSGGGGVVFAADRPHLPAGRQS
ncbi:acetyl hydrolase mbtJ [Mycobacterium tuberculosis T46]|nr:acetyl hydrolase mbtJ [Mycobacterium tuberculosis T46]